MKNNNREVITVPHEIVINNPEDIEKEIMIFTGYLPELMSEVTTNVSPTIIDIRAICGDKVANLKLPIIPFNFKTNTIQDLDEFVKIAGTPAEKKHNANINHQMLQTRYNSYLNDAYAYILAELSASFGTQKTPINAKHNHAMQTKRLVLKDRFEQMLNAISRYENPSKAGSQPSNS